VGRCDRMMLYIRPHQLLVPLSTSTSHDCSTVLIQKADTKRNMKYRGILPIVNIVPYTLIEKSPIPTNIFFWDWLQEHTYWCNVAIFSVACWNYTIFEKSRWMLHGWPFRLWFHRSRDFPAEFFGVWELTRQIWSLEQPTTECTRLEWIP